MRLDAPDRAEKPVTVYWRPGCGFCTRLLGELDRAGVVYERRNIWEEPDAAAYVRSVARGHETVPTVVVGAQIHVNPPPGLVIDLAGYSER